MGKASRRKKERREERTLTPEQLAWHRHVNHLCLHCGAARDQSGVWCRACTLEGQRRSRLAPRLGTPWRKDPRILWPTREAMAAFLDELEAKWAAEDAA